MNRTTAHLTVCDEILLSFSESNQCPKPYNGMNSQRHVDLDFIDWKYTLN